MRVWVVAASLETGSPRSHVFELAEDKHMPVAQLQPKNSPPNIKRVPFEVALFQAAQGTRMQPMKRSTER
ncbi:MAG: hypothetical protein CSA75_02270 [Sorangium cellulosum]|nr:MAG: hypothetical protein CSA75_02270 [Sorangium cellulosum]